MALEALAGHERVWYGRLAGHAFTHDRPVRQHDGVEGDGTDVDDKQLVDHVFAGVGVFVAVVVDPFTAVHDRLACGGDKLEAATAPNRIGTMRRELET